MKNEQHGPFEIRCWCDHFAEYHCAIQHVPLGVSVAQKSYGFGAAEEAAWKEMAMKLASLLNKPVASASLPE